MRVISETAGETGCAIFFPMPLVSDNEAFFKFYF